MLYFTNTDLAKFVNPTNIDVYLWRRTKSGKIIRLKRGLYVTQEQITFLQKTDNYAGYIPYLTTNILMSPSYISTEEVLFLNNIIIENVYATTAITTKKTTYIENSFWRFQYQNISEDLFRGYETKKIWRLTSYRAYPEKALLDYLRLKKGIVFQESYFEELRLEVDRLNFKRLKQFVKRFNRRKIDTCFTYLQKLRWL